MYANSDDAEELDLSNSLLRRVEPTTHVQTACRVRRRGYRKAQWDAQQSRNGWDVTRRRHTELDLRCMA